MSFKQQQQKLKKTGRSVFFRRLLQACPVPQIAQWENLWFWRLLLQHFFTGRMPFTHSKSVGALGSFISTQANHARFSSTLFSVL